MTNAAATAAPAAPETAVPADRDPDYAARLGLVPASAGFRSLAFAIDAAIWLLLASPIVIGVGMAATGDTSLVPVILLGSGYVLVFVFSLVQLITHGRRGVTAGKAALRLRSIAVDDYARPGFWRIVLRALVLWLSTLLLIVVGPALLFASSLWDRERRGRSILDRIGGCWVIDARAGLDPFDAKALRHARRVVRGRPDDGENLPSMASGADAASALRIPDGRSRAGVVGPGGTGAQWAAAAGGADLSLIDGVPGADAAARAAAPTPAGFAPASFAPPSAPGSAAQFFPPVGSATPAAAAESPRPVAHAAPAAAPAASPPPPAEVVQAADAAPPAGTRRAQAMVRFDDGSVVRVPLEGLIGRDPEPAAGERVDAVVRLDDPERLMSKTHAAFGQDADGVWVSDRGSRNGTQLLSPGGDVVDVAAGGRTRVPVGWTVMVGGRSFELVARGADS
jgi:uncharacterized RDD family membrane protein YckC